MTTKKCTAGRPPRFFRREFQNLICGAIMTCLVLSPLCQTAHAEENWLALAEKRQHAAATLVEAATVLVLVAEDGAINSAGSGFVVADGYVLTNAHVVTSGDTYYIANEKLEIVEAKLVKQVHSDDPGVADFALLHFSSPTPLPVLSFNLQIGRMDRVSAWGFPYMITQFDQSMDKVLAGDFEKMPPVVYTEGTVSVLVSAGDARNIIHTAAIAGGNSGGPLINTRGEVVGINTWGYTEEDEGAFINAALPASLIVSFLKSCGITPHMAQTGQSLAELTRQPSVGQNTPAPIPFPAVIPAPSSLFSLSRIVNLVQSGTEMGLSFPAPADTGFLAQITEYVQAGANASTPPTQASLDGPDGVEGLSVAMRALAPKAQQGDADAQCKLGMAYYAGEGAPKNVDQAVLWLTKAAGQDDVTAKYMLGALCILEPEYKDVRRGLNLLREAVDKEPEFASTLAIWLYEGEYLGVERDVKASAEYAARGAAVGDMDAKALLGFLHYFGESVPEDEKKALELAREGEKEENTLALSLLGWLYYDGRAVPTDFAKALAYARSAAEAGEATAMGLLACMYFNGNGVDKDMTAAEGWALRAADQGNEFGQYILGRLYSEGKVAQQDFVTAWAYLDIAASKNISEAKDARDTLAANMPREALNRARETRDQWRKDWGLPLK